MDDTLVEIQKVDYQYNNTEFKEFIDKMEKRCSIYDGSDYCNLINFSTNKDVPFHGWLKYREGYAGSLVSKLMELGQVAKGEMVVDPFCGSGTTSIVAKDNGCIGYGCDINPMSSFITSVKLTNYSMKELDDVLENVKRIDLSTYELEKYASLERYFDKKNFIDLCKIKYWIDNIGKKSVHDILLVAFICIVEECSNRRKDGNGLKIYPTKINNVEKYFKEKLYSIVSDLKLKNVKNIDEFDGYSLVDSATTFADNCMKVISNLECNVGAVIFSPPYANSFDYLETYKLELVFGGFVEGIKGLNELRKKALRSFVGVKATENPDYYVSLLSNEIYEAIPQKEAKTGKIDSRTRKVPSMINGYFYDMEQVLIQCEKILNKGKHVYIVVDQSAYLGKIVPTDLLLGYLGEKHNFDIEYILKTKNANTSAQQLKEFPYLKGNLRGTILSLIKR